MEHVDLNDRESIIRAANRYAEHAVESHLAAGRSVYSGDETNVFEHTPDGRTFIVERRNNAFHRIREIRDPRSTLTQ